MLALIEAPGHVCYRYRLQAFAEALGQQGWTLEAVPLPRSGWDFLAQLPRIAAADAVVLQRKLLPRWRLSLLRKAARLLLYDVDDAVFFRDSNASKQATSASRWRRFRTTVHLADRAMVGNGFLLERAVRCATPGRVRYLPTCIDLDLYPTANHQRSGSQVRLAWIGSRSTMSSLKLAQPGLAAAAHQLPGLELCVVCDQFPELEGVRVVPRVWSSATEGSELANADIGISWLPDHPWSLGKCGLKVLQYMAAGLPVVANPVGMNRELVRHGQTGLLASTPEEWAQAIGRLANSPELRLQMGRAARELIHRHYSVTNWASEFVTMLEELRGRKAPASLAPEQFPIQRATRKRRAGSVRLPAIVQTPNS